MRGDEMLKKLMKLKKKLDEMFSTFGCQKISFDLSKST